MKVLDIAVKCNEIQADRIASKAFYANKRTTEVMVNAYNKRYIYSYKGKRDCIVNIICKQKLLRTIKK